MGKFSARPAIQLRGVRHNNLKNFDLDVPLKQLVVITGLSGSGKSSLALDTLFAEGQRRYIETFSPYARQFLDRMDKPQVDSIQGIPPAIAVEQRNAVRTTRSTVGTMTEICDYMKMLWPLVAQLHCRECGQPVKKDSPQQIWEWLGKTSEFRDQEVLITFDLPLSDKLPLAESLGLIAKQGYQRLLARGEAVRLDEAMADPKRVPTAAGFVTVIQDRVRVKSSERARLVEACEQAYHFGKGKLTIRPVTTAGIAPVLRFSNRRHCAHCDLEYREPVPAMFSFNHPLGACPECRGFGRIISIDYRLAIPDRTRTLAQGVVKPWLSGQGAECQTDLLRMCRELEIPTDIPFQELPEKWQTLVIEGEPGYGKDEEHEWPRAWYGVKGYFRWLESKAYKMHVRVLLSRYRAYTPCPACGGQRFQPEPLLYLAGRTGTAASNGGLNLAQFYQMPIRDSREFVQRLDNGIPADPKNPLHLVLNEVRSRLDYLDRVGLGYLTLDRPTRSLSGGETERVNLTTCLGTRLVNTLFVLDEPSVGLHPRDTDRLVEILEQLRDAGNTVVVVEHEASVMRAADEIIDMGPGHGAEGGQVVFQGPFTAILESADSLTGKYLSGRTRIDLPFRRDTVTQASWDQTGVVLRDRIKAYGSKTPSLTGLKLIGATLHNLKDLSVSIPLNRLVCVTGVSGSGKTTLMREVLYPLLERQLQAGGLPAPNEEGPENGTDDAEPGEETGCARLEGAEALGRVVLADQSALGKTPRSNPAVYVGAFDFIREVFADSEPARQAGLNASAFSFNSKTGQCDRCRGAGFEKIEMQFLSDVFIRCPDCEGRRYKRSILGVKISAPAPSPIKLLRKGRPAGQLGKKAVCAWSIADALEATVDEALEFLSGFETKAARNAVGALTLLQEVGLGYLKLGQPINTLSGGESQRLKIVRELAEAGTQSSSGTSKPTLFLFDEPTTGLHFDDVRILLKVFQRLVDAGHTVVIIEHNLDVIKCADWVIDLGPDAGDRGGEIVATGTPEEVARCERSYTGQALKPLLKRGVGNTRRAEELHA